MANTFISINLHLIFAVKNREALIPPQWQKRIHSYMGGILSQKGHIPLAIGGTDNHVHLFFSYKATQLLPDLVRELKINTSKLINENHIILFKFNWQAGYSCFSYSHSQIDKVKAYIQNQTLHHKGVSFIDELKTFLDRFDIGYDEQYIFDDI